MKIHTIFSFAQAIRQVKTTIVYSSGALSPHEKELLEGYSQLRTDYVLQENWPIHVSGIDLDSYDVAAKSAYVIAHVGNKVVAGMRATRISSLYGSLSLGMWHNAKEKQAFEEQLARHSSLVNDLDDKELWDITRLIAETSVLGNHSTRAKVYSRVGLLKVMSAGVAIAGPRSEQKVAWLFTTNPRMLRFMERSNIQAHVLVTAKISESDSAPASLCVAYPHEIVEELKRLNPAVHRLAQKEIKSHVKKSA